MVSEELLIKQMPTLGTWCDCARMQWLNLRGNEARCCLLSHNTSLFSVAMPADSRSEKGFEVVFEIVGAKLCKTAGKKLLGS